MSISRRVMWSETTADLIFYELEKDYIRNLNKKIEIRTYRSINKSKEFYGNLKEYDKDFVKIETEDGEVLEFAKTDIALIRQAIEF